LLTENHSNILGSDRNDNQEAAVYIEDLNQVPSKYFQKLVNTQDLGEIRVSAGSNIFRLIGFFDGPKIVVVAHGFQKKIQQTPKRAIQIAHERKREYFRRKTK
jgi:phage-related protein